MNGRTDAKKRVLIVDDSSTMRAMLDGILAEDAGFVVVGLARGVEEAVALIDATWPHIVMTDLCMPQLDGSALLTMLQTQRALCKVVISTRANLSEAREQELIALGASAIFDKQQVARDPKAFLAALHRAVDCPETATTPPVIRAPLPEQPAANVVRFPMPDDEPARARAVHALKIANLDVDPRLNILVRHLARLSGYPIAAVNVVGPYQLWVKAAVGIVPNVVPRGDSLCAYAICAAGVAVITDTLEDPVFRALPMVTGGPRIRSYLGAPIISENGVRLGMVCAADTRPRHPTKAEMDVITDVAALVASALATPIPQLRSAA